MIVEQIGCVHAAPFMLVVVRVAKPVVELHMGVALYREEGGRLLFPGQADLVCQFALDILSSISIEAAW